MEPFQLLFDAGIMELEKENHWDAAANAVLQHWKDQPNSINRLLCAGTQLWYTLLIMEKAKDSPSSHQPKIYASETQLREQLILVTHYGFNCFADNPLFNSYFGYMISLTPNFFIGYNWDYLGLQKKGEAMIRYAYSQDPDNPFIKALYFGLNNYENNTPYRDACKEIWSELTQSQWGNSAVQQYFFHILSGDTQ